MQNELEYLISNVHMDPVDDDMSIAFNHVVMHVQLQGTEAQREALEEFESFGKIVVLRQGPVKPFFLKRFQRAAMSMRIAS